MQKTVGALLIPLGLLLVFGMIALVGAGVARGAVAARRTPRFRPQAPRALRHARRRARDGVVVWAAAQWWKAAAGDYASYLYKPLAVKAQVEDGSRLVLRFDNPGWLNRRTDDLLPDHGHLMHLYVIHLPAMDRVWHLHPESGEEPTRSCSNCLRWPPAVTCCTAISCTPTESAETVTAQLALPEIHGTPLAGRRCGKWPARRESGLQSGCV